MLSMKKGMYRIVGFISVLVFMVININGIKVNARDTSYETTVYQMVSEYALDFAECNSTEKNL